MNLSAVIAILACLVGLVMTVRAQPHARTRRAVSASLVIATTVPVTAIKDDVIVVTALCTVIAVCLIALLTPRPPARVPMWGALCFVAFTAWLMLRILGQFSLTSTALQVLMLASVALVALLVPRLTRDDLPGLAMTFLVLAIVHGTYAVLEQEALPPLWQLRGQSVQTIEDRVNVIASWLPGRAQTSFAHPIPFATFMCVAFLFLVHATIALRKPLYALGAAFAAVGLVCSGTRSAFVALIVALIAYLIANIRWRRLLAMSAAAGGLVIVSLVANLTELLALDSRFENSVSYIHRSQVAGSVSSLWARDDLVKWVGSGAGSTIDLFTKGIVRGAAGIRVFDNTYISLLALSGIVSLLLFAAIVLWSLRGGALAIGVATFAAVMGFSFDEQTWQIPLLMLAIGALLPSSLGTLRSRTSSANEAVRSLPHDEPAPSLRRRRP